MISNNKISSLVSTQLPFFVRNDHDNFVAFMEAYYEWLEQANNTVNIAKSMKEQLDVDQTDIFIQNFYDNFLPLIPKEAQVDKALLIKHIKDFYTARGSEKSIRFLMRVLFNEEVEFYYPKQDILKASDGKWFVEKSIKIDDITVDGVANTSNTIIDKFIGQKIRGSSSNATALVERVDTYYESSSLVREVKISGLFRDFVSGEQILATFTENGQTKNLSANLFSGGVNSVEIIRQGASYKVGDVVQIESDTGSGAVITVGSVSRGNLTTIGVLDGGAGFQAAAPIFITGGGGTGANAAVVAVTADNFYHPNSYNVVISTIALEANTPLNNTVYSNLNSSNVNTKVANAMSYFVYANTGPISTTILYSSGSDYVSLPTISATANTRVRNLGILGKMRINNGGEGYRVNDSIEITNVIGGYGVGAAGRVRTVNQALGNTITEVEFVQVPGHITGGAGYDMFYLPKANVISTNVQAFGANVEVTAVLGDGESLVPVGSTVGAIENLIIVSRGSGYNVAPILNLTANGDGTAQAVATIIQGTYTYPGRYLNDDGHLSGYNFLENRDYYQPFSYVVKLKQSMNKYRQALKDLIHPAGMKMFGEYLVVDDYTANGNLSVSGVDSVSSIIKTRNYRYATGNLTINYTSHGLSANDIVSVEWLTGNVANSNTVSGPFAVKSVINVNNFIVSANIYNVSSGSIGTANVAKFVV